MPLEHTYVQGALSVSNFRWCLHWDQTGSGPISTRSINALQRLQPQSLFNRYQCTNSFLCTCSKSVLRIDTGGWSLNCGTPGFRGLCNYRHQVTFNFLLILCQLDTLSNDTINMQISFSIPNIGVSKSNNMTFYVILLNTDISVTA